ncbi:MAG: hypothetical protein F9K32_12590 [Desulfobulbaceae bacterium]|nr:MAG: hypothetical protein F9K32_12590 [Desulfobulbaceae bacterium]
MDAVVLAPMPQTPAKAPGQSGQTTGRNDSSFGPVLSSAIAGSGTDRKTSQGATTRSGDAAESDRAIDIESIDELDELTAFLAANNLTLEELPQDLREMIASAYGLPALAAATDDAVTGQASPLPAGMLHFPHTALPQGMVKFLEMQQSVVDTAFQPPAALFTRKEELPLILSQLQQIISANEGGNAVVMQGPADAITLDELTGLTPRLLAGEVQVQGNLATKQSAAALAADPAVPAVSAEIARTAVQAAGLPGQAGDTETAPATPATSLRQDVQQATDTSAMAAAGDRDQAGGQTGKQENNATAQQSAAAGSANAAPQPDQPGHNGIFSSVLQESTAAQPATGQGSTVTLPSGTLVSEHEVVNQLIQRFQMSTRLQSSKINLRLHPAELGELKIDLTVKEGTIKASVFAQNQHVQEILERNMPRLRTTLEQQGFTIDEIVVSFKSDTAKEFDLFDGRSTRDQNFSFSGNTRSHVATFESAFDTSLTGTGSPDSGLSVRA